MEEKRRKPNVPLASYILYILSHWSRGTATTTSFRGRDIKYLSELIWVVSLKASTGFLRAKCCRARSWMLFARILNRRLVLKSLSRKGWGSTWETICLPLSRKIRDSFTSSWGVATGHSSLDLLSGLCRTSCSCTWGVTTGQSSLALLLDLSRRNGSGSNIGAQTFKVCRPTNLLISTLGFPWEVCKKKRNCLYTLTNSIPI